MGATPAAAPTPTPAPGRRLGVATLVGIALAVVFLGSLWWRREAFTLVVVVLVALAGVEIGRVLRGAGRRVHTDVLVAGSVAWLVATHVAGVDGQRLGVVVLLIAAVVRSLAERERVDATATIATTVLMGTWTAGLASFAILLLDRPGGRVAVVAVILGAALSDVGAYAVGSLAGRHRIAPSVSPNKTWEGLIGGLVVTGVAGAVALPLLDPAWTAVTGASVAVVAGLAGFVGDLAESMLKRDIGVKDFGSVLPGHGGVLDRVDGILFALPVGSLAVTLLV